MKNKKQINIDVGYRIKIYREQAGLTQEKFSELIELEAKTISVIECGNVGVSLTTLKKICEVLGVSADELLFETLQENNVDGINSKLKRLSSEQFKIVDDIIKNLIKLSNI